MSERMIEHECMTCGKIYWHWNTPHYCPYCNASMVREIIDSPIGEAPVRVIKECLDDRSCRNLDMIDDLRENLHARDIALAAKQQTITAMAARIAALEAQNGKLRETITDLEWTVREYQE